MVLGLLYLVVALVYGVYEWNAHAILDRADRLDVSGKHLTAATAYGLVLDKYPLSATVMAARRGLDRVGVASGDFSNPTPVPGSHAVRTQVLDARTTDPLPLVGLPVATVILVLAFAARIRRRPWLAVGVLMLGAATTYMSLSLLVRDGMLSAAWLQPTARMYRETPMLPYFATYVFVTLACLSTLTWRGERKAASTPSLAAADAPQPEVIRVAAFVAGTRVSAPIPSSGRDAIDSLPQVEVDAESPEEAVGFEAIA